MCCSDSRRYCKVLQNFLEESYMTSRAREVYGLASLGSSTVCNTCYGFCNDTRCLSACGGLRATSHKSDQCLVLFTCRASDKSPAKYGPGRQRTPHQVPLSAWSIRTSRVHRPSSINHAVLGHLGPPYLIVHFPTLSISPNDEHSSSSPPLHVVPIMLGSWILCLTIPDL